MNRALIVKKHWLDKIFDEGKVWEMRTTKTNVTGKIGLIESGSGLIVGEADLIGCSEIPVPKHKGLIKYHKVNDLTLLDKWKYAWFLSNVNKYENPIKYKHPQGAVIWVNLSNQVLK